MLAQPSHFDGADPSEDIAEACGCGPASRRITCTYYTAYSLQDDETGIRSFNLVKITITMRE